MSFTSSMEYVPTFIYYLLTWRFLYILVVRNNSIQLRVVRYILIVNVYYIFMALNMFSKGEESIPLLKKTIM